VKWNNHNGKTTIVGDAAHPIVPFRGQGLNSALQNAALYVEAIEAVVSSARSLEEGVSEYDAEISERGRKEIGVPNLQTYGT
jgi:2-polyprenyl-6-methoxyphenol hydroxylase-like FAD-dependent oxidoreductase